MTNFLNENKAVYELGDAVAWDCFDGKIMCGTVTAKFYDSYDIRRVDGGLCSYVSTSRIAKNLRAATLDEWDAAIKSFIKQPEGDTFHHA